MAYQMLDSRDIVADFYPRYEQSIAGSYAMALAMPMTSDREAEDYKWLGQASGMREWVGGRHENSLNKFTFTVRNKKYEDTMVIPLEDLRRDKTGQLRIRIAEMAQKAAEHPNRLIADVINANPVCYDGQNLYDTDHSEGSSGTQINALAAAQYASLNIADADAPTADEMAVILVDLIGHFYSIKDDQGDPINGSHRQFHVLVSTVKQWSAATRAISLNNLTSGATNPVQGLTARGISISLEYDPRLTTLATNKQFVISAIDGVTKPFIDQIEEPLTTQLVGVGSEYEFDNDAHKFGLKSTRAIAPGFWQKTLRATLS